MPEGRRYSTGPLDRPAGTVPRTAMIFEKSTFGSPLVRARIVEKWSDMHCCACDDQLKGNSEKVQVGMLGYEPDPELPAALAPAPGELPNDNSPRVAASPSAESRPLPPPEAAPPGVRRQGDMFGLFAVILQGP